MRDEGDQVAIIVAEANKGRESNAIFVFGPLFDLVEFGRV